jgi:hypothetical protein
MLALLRTHRYETTIWRDDGGRTSAHERRGRSELPSPPRGMPAVRARSVRGGRAERATRMRRLATLLPAALAAAALVGATASDGAVVNDRRGSYWTIGQAASIPPSAACVCVPASAAVSAAPCREAECAGTGTSAASPARARRGRPTTRLPSSTSSTRFSPTPAPAPVTRSRRFASSAAPRSRDAERPPPTSRSWSAGVAILRGVRHPARRCRAAGVRYRPWRVNETREDA